jgi:hypothetical protein
MSKKFIGGLAPLLAIAAFAIAPAAAQAAPHWLSNGSVVPEEEVVPVATSGTLTFNISDPVALFTLKCKVNDTDLIENPKGGGAGLDVIPSFVLSGCKAKGLCPKGTKAEVIALALPWHSELIGGVPIRDAITLMMLEVKCSGAFSRMIASFPFTPVFLTPAVGPKSALEFGAGSGELEDNFGGKVTVTGKDKLKGPPGDEKITAA